MRLLLIATCVVLSSCSIIDRIERPVMPKKMMSLKWSKKIGPSYETGNLPVIFNGGRIHEDTLYIGDHKNGMTAYELSTGRKIWQEYDQGTYQSRVTIVEDKIIYGTTEGRLILRQQEDGEKVYEIDLGSPIESEITYENGRLFLQLRSHQVFALDAISGKILWSYKRGVPPGTTNQSSASPVVVGQQLVVGFADGSLVSFNKFDGEMNWEKNLAEKIKFNDVDNSPAVVGNHLLSFSNGGLWQLLM